MTVAAAPPPLEEREAELGAVARVLDSARAGAGGGLLVEGAPGIGKTRLLAGARAGADGMRVLAARASELERDFPFAVVRQLLEPALAEPALLTGAAALAAPVLAAPGADAPAAEAEPAALHGLYWLTANLAARGPVLLLVDDLHWADLPSLRWLAYLAQRLDGLPAALVAAARPAEAGGGQPVLDLLAANPAVEVLHPGTLTEAAVTRFAERALGGPCEPEFASACRRATGGNPFLLGELIRELAAAGVAPTAANAPLAGRQTSRTVSRAALVRLRRLPAAASGLAHAVAVLGDGAEPALAAALAGLDAATAAGAAAALEEASILAGDDGGIGPRSVVAVGWAPAGSADSGGGALVSAAAGVAFAAGLAGGGRRLSFAHPLVRASVYADFTAADRAQAHGRAAELLTAAGAAAERVAIHRHACDPAGDPEAVRVLREAAATARGRGATEVAASHLRRALLEPPEPEVEPHVRRELGAAELQGGRTEAAAEQLALAAAGLADPIERALATADLGAALQLSGRVEESVEALNRAIAELPDSERELGLLLQATRAAASGGTLAAFAKARQGGLRFRAPVEAPATPGERLFAAGMAYREATTGRADRARELALPTLSLLEDPGPTVPTVIAAPLALTFGGALEDATRAWDTMLDWARRRGSQFAFAQASHLRAATWLRRGNLAEAEADGEHAFEHPSFMVRPGVLALVEVRLLRGDVDGAERLWREADMDSEPLTGRSAVITRQTGARLLAARGRREQALAELLACRAMEDQWRVRTPSYSTWRSDAVTLLAALGRGEEAQALAEEDVTRARRFGDPRPLGIALRAAGLAAPGGRGTGGDASPGLQLLEESVAVLKPSAARLELASSLLELGAALRRQGRRADARAPLRDAVDLAAECGATAVSARAHDELVAAGARPRRDPVESRSRLTASELRVARMAADGMTNKEIAQALFLTEKTIEVHLTSTYRKLDIGSRSQLPRALT